MADDEQPPPLPTPAAPTATKQAVASALDAPDDSSVNVDSPLPPNSLFHRSIPLPADDIFDDDDDDDLLAQVPLPQGGDKTTPSHPLVDVERDDGALDESPSKRQRTVDNLSSPLPMSQPSLQSATSTPMICRIGDIPPHYLDPSAEDNDSEFEMDMFAIDEEINMSNLDANDPRRLKANRNATMNNNIHAWARADSLSIQPPIPESEASFRSFETSFSRQIHHRFNESRRNGDDGEDDDVRLTRSSSQAAVVDDEDIDAVNLETTDTRRLTRLMFEDIITVHEGTALKLYVSKNAVRNTSAWWHDTFQFAVDSLHLRPIRMHSRDFYVFDVTVSCDTEHHGVTSGTTTLSALKTKFDRMEGFHISFNGVSKMDGRPLIIPVAWRHFISNAYDLLFFAPPKDSTRVFTYFFKTKDSPDAIRQLFRVLSNEVIGDYGLAYSLYTAYLSRLLAVTSKEKKSEQQNPDRLCSFDNHTTSSKAFFKAFDDYCKQCLDGIIDGWNDISQPIISLTKFHEWIDAAQETFPSLWAHMCNLREVYGGKGKKKRSINKVNARRRQVFMTLLSFKRMQSPHSIIIRQIDGMHLHFPPAIMHIILLFRSFKQRSSLHQTDLSKY